MNILVLNGSPRPKANTKAHIEAFKEGAEAKGHSVRVFNVGNMKINGCLGCEFCHTKGDGACVQKDDMQEIYPYLANSDMVVIASPIYYWGFSGQMMSLITRFYRQRVQIHPEVLRSHQHGYHHRVRRPEPVRGKAERVQRLRPFTLKN